MASGNGPRDEALRASPTPRLELLTVGPALARLSARAELAGWCSHATHSHAEAAAWLEQHTPALLITNMQLADGDWRAVFDLAGERHHAIALALSSPHCSIQLLLDVLARGGLDLLPEPCPDEWFDQLLRRVSNAALHLQQK